MALLFTAGHTALVVGSLIVLIKLEPCEGPAPGWSPCESRTPCKLTLYMSLEAGPWPCSMSSAGCCPHVAPLKRSGLSGLLLRRVAAARGGREECWLLCPLACQPGLCSLTLMATQESHGVSRGTSQVRVSVATESQLRPPVLPWPPGSPPPPRSRSRESVALAPESPSWAVSE